MGFNIKTRYAAAVHSGNLTVKSAKNNTEEAQTVIGDPEVLGAYGLADRDLERGFDNKDRKFSPAPLAVPLERLFAGDSNAAHSIVRILADMAFAEARKTGIQLDRVQAQNMAKATLAWFRNGTCQPCKGRGKPAIKDSPVLAAHDCEHCKGTGKILFEKQFRFEWKPLARWLKEAMEMECGRAAPAAMRALSQRMDLG